MRTDRARWLLLASVLAAGACYETQALRVRVVPMRAEGGCVATIDRVFSEAGFGRGEAVSGPNIFYQPRGSVTGSALRWGVGVWLTEGSDDRVCGVELEALAAETGCGLQCPLVWQRGEEYDRTVTEMAARIRTALRGGPPSS
jgi:hypothetical protein